MYPGWAAYYFSFSSTDWSVRLFVLPAVVVVITAWKIPASWLVYLIFSEVIIFIPNAIQSVLMIGNAPAHLWLGLAGLYQLVWIFVGLIIGLVGRFVLTMYQTKKEDV